MIFNATNAIILLEAGARWCVRETLRALDDNENELEASGATTVYGGRRRPVVES